MEKTYEKPNAEIIDFELYEAIMDDGDPFFSATEGEEEW